MMMLTAVIDCSISQVNSPMTYHLITRSIYLVNPKVNEIGYEILKC